MTGLDAHVVATVGSLALDVQLSTEACETVVVVGPNGAGKTTLLRAIAGLVPMAQGRIAVGGRPIDALAPQRRPIGMVFQDGLLFPHMTVLDNVAFGLRARGTARRLANEHAAQLLEQFGLSAYADAPPAVLSGGQAQRVAIARALATTPAVLLLDEPLTGLDADARVEVRRALQDVARAHDGVRVVVTHDPLDALTLADRLVVLEGGRVVQQGTPDDVRRHPRSPYAAQFLGANVLEGQLLSQDELRLPNGTRLHVALDAVPLGPCMAVVEPAAVTLFADAPHASARNAWATTVVDLEREPSRIRVRLGEPVPLVADVTSGAVTELALAPGARVWCAVKATAITVHPR